MNMSVEDDDNVPALVVTQRPGVSRRIVLPRNVRRWTANSRPDKRHRERLVGLHAR